MITDMDRAVFERKGTQWVQMTSWIPENIARQMEREYSYANPGRQFAMFSKDEARARGIYVP